MYLVECTALLCLWKMFDTENDFKKTSSGAYVGKILRTELTDK